MEVMAIRNQTTGRRSQTTALTGITRVRAQRNEFCTAAVLGIISQKISTKSERNTEESNSPQLAENRSAKTVAILEATITATLLKIKIVARKLLGFARSRSILAARLSPSST